MKEESRTQWQGARNTVELCKLRSDHTYWSVGNENWWEV